MVVCGKDLIACPFYSFPFCGRFNVDFSQLIILQGILVIANCMQGKLYMIMEISRAFDQIYKEHLDGVYVSNFVFSFTIM